MPRKSLNRESFHSDLQDAEFVFLPENMFNFNPRQMMRLLAALFERARALKEASQVSQEKFDEAFQPFFEYLVITGAKFGGLVVLLVVIDSADKITSLATRLMEVAGAPTEAMPPRMDWMVRAMLGGMIVASSLRRPSETDPTTHLPKETMAFPSVTEVYLEYYLIELRKKLAKRRRS